MKEKIFKNKIQISKKLKQKMILNISKLKIKEIRRLKK